METSPQSNQGALLVELARTQLGRGYAPYSKLQVACALETEDGTIITGVNVENASLGLTICAERCDVCSAIAAGHRRFRAVAVVATTEGITPCGACRQVLSEFMEPSAPVYYADAGGIRRTTIGDLLPSQHECAIPLVEAAGVAA
jgi:cytidine deaminase